MKVSKAFKLMGFASALAVSQVSLVNATGGNGSGNEPTTTSQGGWSVCDVVPLFCATTDTGGNGSGNEPQ